MLQVGGVVRPTLLLMRGRNRVRVRRVQGLDRQAERTATLTSCAMLLLLTFFFLERMNPNVTDPSDRVRRYSFVLVQHNTTRIRPACCIADLTINTAGTKVAPHHRQLLVSLGRLPGRHSLFNSLGADGRWQHGRSPNTPHETHFHALDYLLNAAREDTFPVSLLLRVLAGTVLYTTWYLAHGIDVKTADIYFVTAVSIFTYSSVQKHISGTCYWCTCKSLPTLLIDLEYY